MAGKDKLVVLWSICDHISTSATDTSSTKSPGTPSGGSILKQTSKTGGSSEKAADGPSIGPRGVYQGHEDTVEDVQFCPSRYQELITVQALVYVSCTNVMPLLIYLFCFQKSKCMLSWGPFIKAIFFFFGILI